MRKLDIKAFNQVSGGLAINVPATGIPADQYDIIDRVASEYFAGHLSLDMALENMFQQGVSMGNIYHYAGNAANLIPLDFFQ